MISKGFLLRPFASETKYYSIQSTKGRTANWRFCGRSPSLILFSINMLVFVNNLQRGIHDIRMTGNAS